MLIVDDDPSVRESLRRLLKNEQYEVKLAGNGDEAMECLQGTTVDLVLLDLNLGAEDGWEVFQRITECDASIPVVIVTAAHEQEALALEAGADALVEKPIDVGSFLEVVKGLLAETPEERLCRRGAEGECLHYVPRWGEKYFATMAERYAKPLQLGWGGGEWRVRKKNGKEEKLYEHRIGN